MLTFWVKSQPLVRCRSTKWEKRFDNEDLLLYNFYCYYQTPSAYFYNFLWLVKRVWNAFLTNLITLKCTIGKKTDVEHNAAGLPKKKLFLNEYPRLDTLWFSFHFLFGTREFNEKNTKNTEVCEWTELTKLISFQVVSSSYFTF